MQFAEGSYEGKSFCVPLDFDDENTTTITRTEVEECNFFSIGSNDQWGFEQEVIQKLPHCVTHTFDCTLPNHQPRKKPVSENIVFHPHCIGSGDHHESVVVGAATTNNSSTNNGDDNHAPGGYLPYHELWKFMHTTKPPKLLKIDVEGFEFGVMPSMLRNSPSEIWPEQIVMEVHWTTRMVDEPTILRTRTAAEISLFFGQLFNYGGYLPVKVTYFDPDCPPCLEVLMVRVLCRNDDEM
mmetsp:Transcript_25494/g.27355  ORF Transcript_25494/g.27355 Transcript_25494/m.27355 type:complete len:239 (-) Transcript_25494:101-817(-)